jgi:hypothetical protein
MQAPSLACMFTSIHNICQMSRCTGKKIVVHTLLHQSLMSTNILDRLATIERKMIWSDSENWHWTRCGLVLFLQSRVSPSFPCLECGPWICDSWKWMRVWESLEMFFVVKVCSERLEKAYEYEKSGEYCYDECYGVWCLTLTVVPENEKLKNYIEWSKLSLD